MSTNKNVENAGAGICPMCGSTEGCDLGEIVHYKPEEIGGVNIDLEGIDFRLKRCRQCSLVYKMPPIPLERLLACYAGAQDSHWGVEVNAYERRFDKVGELLSAHAPGRRVLDVGCFNGAMLKYLGDDWQSFGVEPSVKASELATKRGITMLGATLDDIRDPGLKFDAITALDVAEHVPDPAPFFKRIGELLSPGGVLLLLTGTTDAWSWKLLGSRYWYCSYAGHVNFYSRATMEWIGKHDGWEIAAYEVTSHIRPRFRRRVKDVLKISAYLFGRAADRLGLTGATAKRRTSPNWISAKDHMFVVLKRTGNGS